MTEDKRFRVKQGRKGYRGHIVDYSEKLIPVVKKGSKTKMENIMELKYTNVIALKYVKNGDVE